MVYGIRVYNYYFERCPCQKGFLWLSASQSELLRKKYFEKHCGEKEKMLVTSIFTLSHNAFLGKGEKVADYQHFLLFPTMISTVPSTNFNFSLTFVLLAASTLNLGDSKILLFGKELIYNTCICTCSYFCYINQNVCLFHYLFTEQYIFGLVQILKACADDKISVNEKLKFVLWRVENIVGKGENAGYQHFLLFPQCFQNGSYKGSLKVGIVW